MRSVNLFRAVVLLGLVPLAVAGSETKPTVPKMTLGQIVDKNVAARGGLSAWRSVQTMEMKGKMEAGGNQRASLSGPADKVTLKVVPQRPKE